MDLAGKAILVTGGASGLGAATSVEIIRAGGSVMIADIQEAEPAGEVPAERSRYLRADVTSESDILKAVESCVSSFGRIDGAVNCAGIVLARKAVGKRGVHDLASFRRVVEINLLGSFNVARLAAEAIMKNPPGIDGERGVIVCTASVAAFDGQIGQAAYAASKGGVVGMTLPLAREFAAHGIRVVTVAPGIFETPMMASLPDDARASLAQQVPFPSRLGYPSEYASLVRHIFENRMLNGEVIRLDGAIRMAPR